MIWMRDIIAEVARQHLVPVKEMVGPGRRRSLVRARWEAMHRCRFEASKSLPQIGRQFSRNHTTVLYGLRRFAGLSPNEAKPPRQRDKGSAP